jgi:hypothetical protein
MPLALIIVSLFIQFVSLCSCPLNRVAVISQYNYCIQNYSNMLLNREEIEFQNCLLPFSCQSLERGNESDVAVILRYPVLRLCSFEGR